MTVSVSGHADKIDLLFEHGLVSEVKGTTHCSCYGCDRVAEIEAKCPRCFGQHRRRGYNREDAKFLSRALNRFKVCWGCLVSHVYRNLPLVCSGCMEHPKRSMLRSVWKPSLAGCEAAPWQENAIRAYEDAGQEE